MIELIEGLPEQVVGIEAVGRVTSKDYEEVVGPAIERALVTHEKIRLLHVIGDRFTGQTAPALWEDTRLGLANLRSIERIAVVTDLQGLRALVKGGGWSLPCEVKLFSDAERAHAIDWITEGQDNRA